MEQKPFQLHWKVGLIYKLWHRVQYCIILHNSCHDKKFSNFLGFGLWIKFVKGKNCVNFNKFSRTFVSLFFCRCSCCSSTQRFSYKTSARTNTSQKVSSYAALCKFPFGDWTQPNIKFMAFAYVSYGWISGLQLQQLKIKEHKPQRYNKMAWISCSS